MQVSPSGMAAASQAVPGEFDSRHLLQKDKRPLWGVFLFGRLTPPKRFAFLAQGTVFLALGHRSRETYALTHLAPKKRYQRFS